VIRALRETEPDLLHVEFAQTAAVLLGVSHERTSFRAHDVNWFLMEQQAERLEGLARLRSRALAGIFRRVEPWLYTRFDLVAAISEGDRRLLAPRCAPQTVLLLPLSPNLRPHPDLAPAVPPGPNVLFVGAMSRGFNVQGVRWFLERVWPRVRAEVPAATFYVVGSSPPEAIRAYDGDEGVVVTGFVDDLAPWYRSAAVFVSPILVAGGLLQKVLDAMGMGVPVVATSVSNHGLAATPGRHLRIADESEGFATSVIELLRDGEARERLGAAARDFVAEHYDPERAMDRWEQVLLSLVDDEPRKR
jgi:glycosyltransferase involved in cell wall biosynthesis